MERLPYYQRAYILVEKIIKYFLAPGRTHYHRKMRQRSEALQRKVQKGEMTWEQANRMQRTYVVGAVHEYYKKSPEIRLHVRQTETQ